MMPVSDLKWPGSVRKSLIFSDVAGAELKWIPWVFSLIIILTDHYHSSGMDHFPITEWKFISQVLFVHLLILGTYPGH